MDRTAGSPVLLARIKDEQGTWLCFKQVQVTLLEKFNRQTLQQYLEKMDNSQRLANLVEKDFLCVKRAIKTRASRVTLVRLECVCELIRKVTNNFALVGNLAEISSKAAHRIEDGTLELMRTVANPEPAGPSSGTSSTPLSGACIEQNM